MSMNPVMEDSDRQKPVWKPEWAVVAYIIATVENESVKYVEIPAMDDEYPEMSNRDMQKYPDHLAVAIRKSNHKPVQFHRFSLGTILRNGKFVESFSPRVDGYKIGQPEVDKGYWTTLHGLLDKGEQWQEVDATFQAESYVARDFPKPTEKFVARPGKTERARAKGKARPKAEG